MVWASGCLLDTLRFSGHDKNLSSVNNVMAIHPIVGETFSKKLKKKCQPHGALKVKQCSSSGDHERQYIIQWQSIKQMLRYS